MEEFLKRINLQARDNIRNHQNVDASNWETQEGVLISNAEAIDIAAESEKNKQLLKKIRHLDILHKMAIGSFWLPQDIRQEIFDILSEENTEG